MSAGAPGGSLNGAAIDWEIVDANIRSRVTNPTRAALNIYCALMGVDDPFPHPKDYDRLAPFLDGILTQARAHDAIRLGEAVTALAHAASAAQNTPITSFLGHPLPSTTGTAGTSALAGTGRKRSSSPDSAGLRFLDRSWRPGPDASSVRPRDTDIPASFQTYTELEEEVSNFLNQFTHRMGTIGMFGDNFKSNGSFYPDDAMWLPDGAIWEEYPDHRQHLSNLRIPMIPHSRAGTPAPDFLLYGLGDASRTDPILAQQITGLLDARLHVVMMQVSGAGKTRRLLDVLCTRFGLYFTSAWHQDASPYGSQDVIFAFQLILKSEYYRPDHARFYDVIADPGNDTAAAHDVKSKSTSNYEIAERVFQIVLLARLLIYKEFRMLARRLEISDADACTAWCLLQIRPDLSGMADVFRSLVQILQHLAHSEVANTTRGVLSELGYQGWMPNMLAYDEAQAAATQWPSAFASSSNSPPGIPPGRRSALKPLVASMYKLLPDAATCIAGTNLRLEDVNEALGSTVFKPGGRQIVSNFGESTPDSIDLALRHILTDNLVDKLSETLVNDLAMWLQGRHRYLTTFIQGALLTGPTEPQLQHVLSSILYRAAGNTGDPGFQPLSHVTATKLVPNFLENPHEYPIRIREKLEKAVVEFLLTGECSQDVASDAELVAKGLGRFMTVHDPATSTVTDCVMINENLTLLALFSWANKKTGDRHLLQDHIDDHIRSRNSGRKGDGLELALQYLLFEWFGGKGEILNKIVRFKSKVPKWAGARARLIRKFKMQEPVGITETVQKERTLALGYRSSTAVASVKWFLNAVRPDFERRPILLPCIHFGPDLLLGLELDPEGIADTGLTERIEVLLAVQCKNREKWYDKLSLIEIFHRMAPDGWWKKGKPFKDIAELWATVKSFFFPSKLPVPKQDKGTPGVKDVKYKRKIEWPVIRLLASFDGELNMPNTESLEVGPYPLAVLSDTACDTASLTFQGFKLAVMRKQARQDAALGLKNLKPKEIPRVCRPLRESTARGPLNLERLWRAKFLADPERTDKTNQAWARSWNDFIVDAEMVAKMTDELMIIRGLRPDSRKTAKILQQSTQDDEDEEDDEDEGMDVDEDEESADEESADEESADEDEID